MEQIATQLHEKRTVVDIANASGADWNRIAADAKKMNSRINNGIYKYFLHAKPELQQDQKDHYVAAADLIRAAADSTPDESLSAQKDFLFCTIWRRRSPDKECQISTLQCRIINNPVKTGRPHVFRSCPVRRCTNE